MKKLLKISLALFTWGALFLLQSCNNYPKEIEKPEYGLKNSSTLTVDKIVLTDTATIFYMGARFHPGYWIQIAPDTYLKAGGEKYILTGADSIQIGEHHWMPESGEDSFTLYFPPLPKGTKSVDFIESDCDDCFKIWDIDLTGKGIRYTADIPKEVQAGKVIDKKATLPPVELTSGKTTLNVYISGLREGYKLATPKLYINDTFLMTQKEIEAQSGEGNTFTFEFQQNGTTTGVLVDGGSQLLTEIILSPGEAAAVYVDITARSIHQEAMKGDGKPVQYVGFKGKFASLNTELAMADGRKYTPQQPKEEKFAALDMSSQDWVNKKKQEAEESIALIEKDAQLSPAAKTFLSLQTKIYCMSNVSRISSFYEWEYREKHKKGYSDPIEYEVPKFNDDIIFLLKEYTPGDKEYIYQSEAYSLYRNIALSISSDEKLNELTGSPTGIIQDIKKAMPLFNKVEGLDPLTPEENQLQSSIMPLFKEAFDAAHAEAQRKYDEAIAKGGYTIADTPKAGNDKLLEAIIAQHKGKPLFIDFWATWCGPCLGAMEAIKPFKPEMKEKGVEVIYISGETSPKAKWMSMLPDIGGLHYYLTNDQWRAVCDKYGIAGIPSYMVADKSGKIVFQQTGFPGVEKFKEEFSKVW